MHAHASPGRSPARATAAVLRKRALALVDRSTGRLRAVVALERERFLLWLPVAFGAGISIYFALPAEPPRLFALVSFAIASAALLCAVAWRQRPALAFPMLLLACLFAGPGAARLRTELVAAPVLTRPAIVSLEGRVVLVEPRGSQVRLLLDELAIAGLPPERTPARVRLTTRSRQPIEPGMRLRLRARLAPPSGPGWPGGYDYGRTAFFEQVGGTGYAVGEPTVTSPAATSSATETIARVRRAIALAAREHIPGEAGGVAVALLTGLRADIPDRVWREMQASGLSHILAISGLHLSLVAGTVFLLARALFAAIPSVVLRIPARKPAAIVASIAAFCGMLIAGSPVPAQRAFVMLAIALFALVVDRRPFSMRLVALAATVVLILQPESVVSVSFQMSFAAVIALVAWFEHRPEAAEASADAPRSERGLGRRVIDYVRLVLVTTLLASLATLPFAAFHFQRVPTYGALANLLGVPLTAFWIMPTGLFAILLQPLGLEAPAYALMGVGVRSLIALARAASSLPHASIALAAWPDVALVLCVAGGLWLAIWQQPWRWLGLLPVAAGVIAGLLARPPDLLVSPWLDQVAVRLDGGVMALRERVPNRFLRQQWQAAMLADTVVALPPRDGPGERLSCDALGCVLDRGAGGRVALVFVAGALAEDCARADLVITALRAVGCAGRAKLLDGRELERSGGLAVWFDGNGLRLDTVAARRGARPWARSGD